VYFTRILTPLQFILTMVRAIELMANPANSAITK
jgi:TPP-dependent trihydroxycyclohexane-1,2-dione (THcHDO) dehydratase